MIPSIKRLKDLFQEPKERQEQREIRKAKDKDILRRLNKIKNPYANPIP